MKNIQKLVLVPIEKWEKLGLKEPVKEILVKTVSLKDQSFQKKPISQVKNQQGQGIQKKMMIPQKFPQLSLNTEKDDDSSEVSSVISDKEE